MSFKIANITWGAGFTGSLSFGYAADNAVKFDENRGGRTVIFQNQAGIEVGWSRGTDYIIAGTIRWVPPTSGTLATTGEPLSALDGADGWDAFKRYTRRGQQFRFHGDSQNASGSFILSTAVEFSEPTLEPADGTYTFTFRFRNPNSPYLGY